MLNITHFLYAPQTTSVGNTAVLLPEVVLVRRELLLASWHLASLCSLITAILAAGRVLTACCWHYGNTMRSLSSTVTAGITYSGRDWGQKGAGRERPRTVYLLYWNIGA
jgi:hypothetical protein